jgi:putative flippase GtrA
MTNLVGARKACWRYGMMNDDLEKRPDGEFCVIAHATRLTRKLAGESMRYFVASAAALAADFMMLVGLTEFLKVNYLVSAAVGFSVGLLVNYVLSVTWVFRERRLENRWFEAFGFAAVGLAGLALNEGLMALFVESFGLAYALAKIPATGVGFVFNYGVRRVLLFTKGRPSLAETAQAKSATAG